MARPLLAAAQDAFGSVKLLVVVAERRDDLEAQGMVGLPPRCAIKEAIEVVVGFGVAVPDLV
jgi:hypothetical protein